MWYKFALCAQTTIELYPLLQIGIFARLFAVLSLVIFDFALYEYDAISGAIAVANRSEKW